MTAWSDVSTTQSSDWQSIDTAQVDVPAPTWSTIGTPQASGWESIGNKQAEEFPFATFATLAFAEGTFTDGSTGSLWGSITTNTTVWTQITT